MSDSTRNTVHLNVSKEEALQQGWDHPPCGGHRQRGHDHRDRARRAVPAPDGPSGWPHRCGRDDVPVQEEQIRVAQHDVDGPVAPEVTPFTDATLEVPVRGEAVELHKRIHVGQELALTKEPMARTQRVTETVRRERAQVENLTEPAGPLDKVMQVIRGEDPT